MGGLAVTRAALAGSRSRGLIGGMRLSLRSVTSDSPGATSRDSFPLGLRSSDDSLDSGLRLALSTRLSDGGGGGRQLHGGDARMAQRGILRRAIHVSHGGESRIHEVRVEAAVVLRRQHGARRRDQGKSASINKLLEAGIRSHIHLRVIGQTSHGDKGGRPSQRGNNKQREEKKNALWLQDSQSEKTEEEDEEDERRKEERPDLKLFL